jgi:protocatechuate 3,4-dioxygenase beta subunit
MRANILGVILPFALGAQQLGVGVSTSQGGNPSRNTTMQTQAPESKPEDRCSIEGQVLNAATGELVSKANLILQHADSSRNTGFPVSYTTATDAAGAFAMKDIEPGKYRLLVNRTGFVNGEYGARGPNRPGTTLALEPKQRLTGIVFRLVAHAVITGRVVDSDGDPMTNVQVQTISLHAGPKAAHALRRRQHQRFG